MSKTDGPFHDLGVKSRVEKWLADSYAEIDEQVQSRHFDELGFAEWEHCLDERKLDLALVILDQTVKLARERAAEKVSVVVALPLKLSEEIPDRQLVLQGWEFLQKNLDSSEPPSLYIMRTSHVYAFDPSQEEYRIQLFGVPDNSTVADSMYVRYWRSMHEIDLDEEFSGCIYLVKAV